MFVTFNHYGSVGEAGAQTLPLQIGFELPFDQLIASASAKRGAFAIGKKQAA
jgi:hypothetical protein